MMKGRQLEDAGASLDYEGRCQPPLSPIAGTYFFTQAEFCGAETLLMRRFIAHHHKREGGYVAQVHSGRSDQ
ncbi:MAG: hypothetical protein ACOYNB_01300 [Aquabacterium sp.]|uniref:hypothetical protein n=1 Tax=Aquabacterium sp. TaxID=1872578 RepID=UPI003BBA938B